MRRVRRSALLPAVKRAVARRLSRGGGLNETIVSLAQRRIENRGDSTHKYPELWDHPKSRRRGGHPLMDTRQNIYNTLNGQTTASSERINIQLRGSMIAAYHNSGFTATGNLFIPLTNRANRGEEDLVKGEDFIILRSVTIPQRKIFNTPPEDLKDMAVGIYRAMR